jgi:hypothetical protein
VLAWAVGSSVAGLSLVSLAVLTFLKYNYKLNMDNFAFLREKLTNFTKFCRTNISKRCKGDALKKYNAQLDELDAIEEAKFTQYVIIEVKPYKDNIPAFLSKMMDGSGVQLSELPPEDVAKLSRYIEFFIAFVEQ